MRYTVLLYFLLSACSNPSKQEAKNEVSQEDASGLANEEILKVSVEEETIDYKEYLAEGILVGKNIICHDDNLDTLPSIKLKEGETIKILAVSDSLFNQSNEYCNSFNYVKIAQKDDFCIVDGRSVYKTESLVIDTVNKNTNTKFKIYNTNFFGIGFENEDGLTFCSNYYQPIVISNDQSNHFDLVKVVKNDFFKEASWNNSFDYFEISNNDGAWDKITKIEFNDTSAVLSIHREFQEGYTDFQVSIKSLDSTYYAEFLNYPKIKYE